MIDLLKDPVNIAVVFIAAVLLLWPLAPKILGRLTTKRTVSKLKLIEQVRDFRPLLSDGSSDAVDALCRAIFEEVLSDGKP